MINVQFTRNPPPLIPALNPAWNHFFQIFFRNVISGFLSTMYSYFSLLSSQIKFWRHNKFSIFQKSSKIAPKPCPKSGLGPFFSIFFFKMLLVASQLLHIWISAYYHQNWNFESMIKKKWLNFSKNVHFWALNSWPILNFKVKTCIKEDLVHTCPKLNHSDDRCWVGRAGWLGGNLPPPLPMKG